MALLRIVLVLVAISCYCLLNPGLAQVCNEEVKKVNEQCSKLDFVGAKNDEDLKFLLSDVTHIELKSPPEEHLSFLTVYGAESFGVVGARANEILKEIHPFVAASRQGSGKIVIFGHNYLVNLQKDHKNMTGRKQLLTNSIRWASSFGARRQCRAGFFQSDYTQVTPLLEKHNILYSKIKNEDITSAKALMKYNVIITVFESTSMLLTNTTHCQILKEYLEMGGGLIVAGRSYERNINGHFGLYFKPNTISSDGGLIWNPEFIYAVRDTEVGISTNTSKLTYTHMKEAWDVIKTPSKPMNMALAKSWETITNGMKLIPPQNVFWTERSFYAEATLLLLNKCNLHYETV